MHVRECKSESRTRLALWAARMCAVQAAISALAEPPDARRHLCRRLLTNRRIPVCYAEFSVRRNSHPCGTASLRRRFRYTNCARCAKFSDSLPGKLCTGFMGATASAMITAWWSFSRVAQPLIGCDFRFKSSFQRLVARVTCEWQRIQWVASYVRRADHWKLGR